MIELEEDGYSTFSLTGKTADGSPVNTTVEVDVWQVFNELSDMLNAKRRATPDGERVDYLPEWAAHLSGLFGVPVSHQAASKVYDALAAEVERLEKKDHYGKPVKIPKPTGSPSGPTTDDGTPPA